MMTRGTEVEGDELPFPSQECFRTQQDKEQRCGIIGFDEIAFENAQLTNAP
jgi:hypothetical protein